MVIPLTSSSLREKVFQVFTQIIEDNDENVKVVGIPKWYLTHFNTVDRLSQFRKSLGPSFSTNLRKWILKFLKKPKRCSYLGFLHQELVKRKLWEIGKSLVINSYLDFVIDHLAAIYSEKSASSPLHQMVKTVPILTLEAILGEVPPWDGWWAGWGVVEVMVWSRIAYLFLFLRICTLILLLDINYTKHR